MVPVRVRPPRSSNVIKSPSLKKKKDTMTSTHEEAHHTRRRGNNKDEPMFTIGPCLYDHKCTRNTSVIVVIIQHMVKKGAATAKELERVVSAYVLLLSFR